MRQTRLCEVLLYFLLTLLLLFVINNAGFAQRQLAVHWEIPESQSEASRQLQKLHNSGISILEIDQIPSESTWRQIEELDFSVYAAIPIRFPTQQTFAEPDSSLIEKVETFSSSYGQQASVSSIRLFAYGQITEPEFLEALRPYIRQLKSFANTDIYALSAHLPSEALLPLDFYIYELEVTPENYNQLVIPEPTNKLRGFSYKPTEELGDLITPFKNIIDATSEYPDLPVFMDSGWLFPILEQYPDFERTLSALADEKDPVFPLPTETIPEPSQSIAIPILLLAIWGIFAIHYSGSPLYRKSLFRYFTSHNFFVDDIFRRHIRTSLPSIIIICQNALLLAICFYALFESLFSRLGREALLHHYPWLLFFGNTSISIFLFTFCTIFLLSFIFILWLYFSNKAFTNISQVATLYSWPLQLNLVITTILVPVYMAGNNAFIITILTFMALAVFVISFVLASIDTLKYMRSRKGLFLLGTTGIYIVLLVGIVSFLVASEGFWEVISLSLSLS